MRRINVKICNLLLNKLDKNEYSNVQKEMIRYAFLSIASEIEKIVIMFILFLILGKTGEFLIVLGSFAILRYLCGGIHMKTFWGCFFYSTLMIGLSVYIKDYVEIPIWIYAVAAIVVCGWTYNSSPNHVVPTKKSLAFRKKLALLIVLLMYVLDNAMGAGAICMRAVCIIFCIEISLQKMEGGKGL